MSYGDLEVLLHSRVPLIVVESRDESRVLKLLQRACRRAPGVMPAPVAARAGELTLKSPQGLPLFEWTITDGLRRLDSEGGGNQRNLSDPTEVLRHIRATNLCAVYALVDFHPFLKDPVHVRMLKDICLEYERYPHTLVLLSAEIDMPRELDDLSARCDLALPDRTERRQIVADVAREWTGAHPGRKVETDAQALELFIDNLSGLSAADTSRLARKAIFDDGGTSRRVMGSFLTWLAEKHARVFVLATANEITSLPPELIRKGRFDEIFFVDLPDAIARAEIIAIHLRKRGMSFDEKTLTHLVHASEGFSGAEIEQAVVAALYTANARRAVPSAGAILAEMTATRPLSIVMAERISALRRWAAGRAVAAG